VSSKLGVPTEKIEALNNYAKSSLFTEAEKAALEYADAITDTRGDVNDQLFARLQRHYDDDTISRADDDYRVGERVLALQSSLPHPVPGILESGDRPASRDW
jgi:hypothetical protein